MAIQFGSQPSGGTVYRGANKYLSCSATSTTGSSLGYTWFRNGSTFGSGSSVKANTASVGSASYYCRVVEYDTGATRDTNTVYVSVLATPSPVLNNANGVSDQNYYRGDSAVTFDATATVASGTITYQWQRSLTASSWENVGTNATYTPSTSSVSTYIYRCEVTNTLNGYKAVTYTNAGQVTVNDTPTPYFSSGSAIADAAYYRGAAAAALTAVAEVAKGTVTYQWQISTDGSNYTNISGATNRTYTPPTKVLGDASYRCVATNKLNGYTKTAISSAAVITVNDTPTPAFDADANLSGNAYYKAARADAIGGPIVNASGDVTVQWQKSTDGSSFSNIAGAVGNTYTPSTYTVGTAYYRAVLTNSLNGYTKTYTSPSIRIVTNDTPVPSIVNGSSIANAVYYRGQGAAEMDATATVASGTLTYSWERSPADSASVWTEVATTPKYTPPTNTVGEYLYHCKITNTLNGETKQVYSNTPTITVKATPVPELTENASLSSATYALNDTAAALNAESQVPSGNISYQWQSNASGAWANINGAVSSTYTPLTSSVGNISYRCVVTNALYGYTAVYTTNEAKITVVVTSTVTIVQQPNGASYYRGASADPLRCRATSSASLALQYAWYSGSGTQVGTGQTYTPPTGTVGSTIYYCVVTDVNGAKATSNRVTVTVNPTPSPVYTEEMSIASATYLQGANAKALNASAGSAAGNVTYQWYESADNTSFTVINGATDAAYTPPTSDVGVKYYYCRVRNTLNGYFQQIRTSTAAITVTAIEVPVITTQPKNAAYVLLDAPEALYITATPQTILSYQWEKSTNGTAFTPISGAVNASYTPDTTLAGVFYYRVRVTNGTGAYAQSAVSNAAVITVVLPGIRITKQPQSADYGLNDQAQPLETAATANGTTISYNWQRSQDGETGWESIAGAFNQTYTPPTNNYSITYYRCVITASNNGQTETAITNTARIQVSTATPPVFLKPLVSASYEGNQEALPLDGTATAGSSTVVYQWYWSPDGENFYPISGAVKAKYTPSTAIEGTRYYYVIATAKYGTDSAFTRSNTATITVENVIYSAPIAWQKYLETLKTDFVKLARLEFLQPDGSVAFALDNNPMNKRSGAFLQEGTLTVNLQNGKRRTATVTLANLDGEYEYNVNKVWFGQQIRLSEGLVLPNGQEFYLPQGVFYLVNPEEKVSPSSNTVTWTLDDKWAYLDGTLFGNLEGMYEVPVNTNIFTAVESVLKLDRGNGYMVDHVPPVFTDYYNAQTTTLPSGAVVSYVQTPYTARFESDGQTYADVVLEMNTMVAGWVGYDQTGRLRLDPSQDDILDVSKPIQWAFTPTEKQFLGATYTVKNSEVYNDIIVTGEGLDEYENVSGRATNYDPASDTNVNLIGKKVLRISSPGYASDKQCENLAVFKLKRQTVLQKSVSIESAQIFHLQENQLVTIQRPDKPGQPVERHLVTGFTRPIAQKGNMQIEATSVNDFPVATVNEMPWEE